MDFSQKKNRNFGIIIHLNGFSPQTENRDFGIITKSLWDYNIYALVFYIFKNTVLNNI